MEGIPTDFAPKEPAAEEEWERFYENLVQDFMEQNYGGIVSQVDITAFAVKYLHMHIVSAVFAEESENLTSFLGDGTSAVMIQQKEKLLRRVYPPGTIAVNRSLCQAGRDDNVAYYKFRFAVALECAKWICRGFRKQGLTQAKQGASRLLMPRFLVLNLLDKLFDGKKITIYGHNLFFSRPGVRTMAVSLGVNISPMCFRLQALNLLEHHPISELINNLLKTMREDLKNSREETSQTEPNEAIDFAEEPNEEIGFVKEPNEEMDFDDWPSFQCDIRERIPWPTSYQSRKPKPKR